MPIIIDVAGDWESDALTTKTILKWVIKTQTPAAAHEDDTLLDYVIAGASHLFEQRCRRIFTRAAYTEYHSGDGMSDVFRVKNPPIASAPTPTLYDDTAYVFGSDTQFALNTDFQFDPASGLVKLLWDVPFNAGFNNIKFGYTGGFSSIPDDIKLGVAYWAALLYKLTKDSRHGMNSKAYAEWSESFKDDDLPPFTKQAIENYRLRV